MSRIIEGNEMNLVGDSVRKYRMLRNMSQQKLSEQLELMGVYVCRGSISRIEDKSRTVTDIEIYALSKVFQVELADMIDDKYKCNK